MLSKDFSRRGEFRKLVDGDTKFLDRSEEFGKIAFVSYPRTGNSFLRKLLEQVSGVFTGTDNSLDFTLTLQQSGMLGEEI